MATLMAGVNGAMVGAPAGSSTPMPGSADATAGAGQSGGHAQQDEEPGSSSDEEEDEEREGGDGES